MCRHHIAAVMNVRAIFILFVALYTQSLCANGKSIPPRQECIQKVILEWGDRSPEEIEEVISEIADALLSEWMRKDPNAITGVPDYSFPYAHRNEWYLQYREGCEQKRSKTVYLIEQVLTPSISRMPSYTLSDEQVNPSSRTIDVRGEDWKEDCY